MIKRPSHQVAPHVEEQILALRAEGLTIMEIAEQTGIGKSAVHAHIQQARKDGRLAASQGVATENVDIADDLDDECRGWMLVSRKARADIQERIKAGGKLDLKEAEKALRMAERAKKLSELLRGRVTSRSESTRKTAAEPTEAQRELLDLAKLAAGG